MATRRRRGTLGEPPAPPAVDRRLHRARHRTPARYSPNSDEAAFARWSRTAPGTRGAASPRLWIELRGRAGSEYVRQVFAELRQEGCKPLSETRLGGRIALVKPVSSGSYLKRRLLRDPKLQHQGESGFFSSARSASPETHWPVAISSSAL